MTNGDPDAIILVTPNLNPGGFGGVYNDHPIGVYYISTFTKRIIFNEDSAAMPVGAAFNVIIPADGTGAFVHMVTTINRPVYLNVTYRPCFNEQQPRCHHPCHTQ
jgi:hypothetical protein